MMQLLFVSGEILPGGSGDWDLTSKETSVLALQIKWKSVRERIKHF